MIKLGDIFKSSWGYDQTNVDFYQVTRVISEKTIEVTPIEGKRIEDEKVIPMIGEFTGEPMRRRPRFSQYGIYINGECSFMSASLWDGQPCYVTHPLMGH